MKHFTPIETNMLIVFLEFILENQKDSSSNDLILPVNSYTLSFLDSFNAQVDENERLEVINNEVIGLDISLTEYFLKRLKEV